MDTYYYVPKSSDTYSDVLVVWGLATVLADVLEQAGVRNFDHTLIKDSGTHFVVRLPQPFQSEWLEHVKARRLTYYLVQKKEGHTGPSRNNVVFLDEQYELAKRQHSISEETPETRELHAASAAHPLLSHFGAISSLQADTTCNKIYKLSPESDIDYRKLIEVIVRLFACEEANEALLQRNLKQLGLPTDQVTASSLINPTQGKGGNRPKPTGASLGNMRVVWVLEWLKFIGFHAAGAAAGFKDARNTVKEYRVVVLVPKRIHLRYHRDIYDRFLPTYFGKSALKLDCMASLNYAYEFLRYMESPAVAASGLRALLGATLRDVVSGFLCAGFLKTSQFAFSVSRVTGYDLPVWISLSDDATTIDRYQEVIEEHRQCIQFLNETRGEEQTLLTGYRDWLSDGSRSIFLDFLARYAEHRMHCAANDRPCAAFTTTNLEVILMNNMPNERPLAPVLENEGFRNVATAIRRGTINAQYRRKSAKGLPSGMDVHFGLSHELRRNAPYRDKFIASLCNYLNIYNLENLRVSSRGEQPRKNVETADIEAIIRLVDEYGSELICSLLLAYGYARDPREKDVEEQSTDNKEGEQTHG